MPPILTDTARLSKYGIVCQNGSMPQKTASRYHAKVDKAGRVVIPVEIRQKAQLHPGAALTITVEPSGRIVLEPVLTALREAQEYFLHLGPAEESWSDEILAERRLEARREIED
jgi:AbrB family looped-hinge helix DNA binding protein